MRDKREIIVPQVDITRYNIQTSHIFSAEPCWSLNVRGSSFDISLFMETQLVSEESCLLWILAQKQKGDTNVRGFPGSLNPRCCYLVSVNNIFISLMA